MKFSLVTSKLVFTAALFVSLGCREEAKRVEVVEEVPARSVRAVFVGEDTGKFKLPISRDGMDDLVIVDAGSSCGCSVVSWEAGMPVPDDGVDVKIIRPSHATRVNSSVAFQLSEVSSGTRLFRKLNLEAWFFPDGGVIVPKVIDLRAQAHEGKGEEEVVFYGASSCADWEGLRFEIGGNEVASSVVRVDTLPGDFGDGVDEATIKLLDSRQTAVPGRESLAVFKGDRLIGEAELIIGQERITAAPKTLLVPRAYFGGKAEGEVGIDVFHSDPISYFFVDLGGKRTELEGSEIEDGKHHRSSHLSLALSSLLSAATDGIAEVGRVEICDKRSGRVEVVVPVVVF